MDETKLLGQRERGGRKRVQAMKGIDGHREGEEGGGKKK